MKQDTATFAFRRQQCNKQAQGTETTAATPSPQAKLQHIDRATDRLTEPNIEQCLLHNNADRSGRMDGRKRQTNKTSERKWQHQASTQQSNGNHPSPLDPLVTEAKATECNCVALCYAAVVVSRCDCLGTTARRRSMQIIAMNARQPTGCFCFGASWMKNNLIVKTRKIKSWKNFSSFSATLYPSKCLAPNSLCGHLHITRGHPSTTSYPDAWRTDEDRT